MFIAKYSDKEPLNFVIKTSLALVIKKNVLN